MDALVTYGWNRIAYNILLSLSRVKLKVGVADSSRLAMSLWSRFAKKRLVYPSFYQDANVFIEWLEKAFLQYRPKVYIPAFEEIFIVAKNLDRLQKTGTIIPISDLQTLKKLHLKNELLKLAESLDIPMPLSIQPRNDNDVKRFAAETGFPVVLKHISSNGAKMVFYCYSTDELLKSFEKISHGLLPHQYPILQQYIAGDGYGVSLLLNRGKTRAIFTHKRLREKTFTGGTSSKRISIRNSALEEYGIRLLEHVNFHGAAMVEFKYDERSKKGYLLEVNPRFWGSLALPIAAGIDFPLLLYKMATEGDIKFTPDYKEGVVVRWILGDILAVFSEIKHTKRLLKPIKQFFVFDDNGFDDFCWADPLPFAFELLYYLIKFLKTFSINPQKESILEIDKL